MGFLTDRTLATGVTLQDLIHIVITGDTSQNPAGSSYKATIQQVSDAILPNFTGNTQLYEVGTGADSTQRVGVNNYASGDCSLVSGGIQNTTSSNSSTIGGGKENTASGTYSFVGGGRLNKSLCFASTVSGGYQNTSSGQYSSITSGKKNTILNQFSTISGGYCNTTRCFYNYIGTGANNTTVNTFAVIGGGGCNTNSGYFSSLFGGRKNTVTSQYSFIGGGSGNTINHEFSGSFGKDVVSTSACTFHVNYLGLHNTPVSDPTNNNVLVRDSSTGVVKLKNISTTLHNYGSYYSVLDQTPAVVGTTYTISAETQSFASGISVTNGGRYTLTNGGVYNIQFSLQILKTAGTKPLLYIWLYKNGSNVPYSNTEFTMDGSNGDRHVASWNFLESFNSGEYFEIRWATTITNVTLDYIASPTYGPEIPSVIITISQVA